MQTHVGDIKSRQWQLSGIIIIFIYLYQLLFESPRLPHYILILWNDYKLNYLLLTIPIMEKISNSIYLLSLGFLSYLTPIIIKSREGTKKIFWSNNFPIEYYPFSECKEAYLLRSCRKYHLRCWLIYNSAAE